MNNLKKIGLSALAGSLATFSATAADFSVSGGASITFSTAPASGASIFITEISGAVGGTVTPSDTSVTADKLNTALLTGLTDIGAGIADADLFLVDDGASGTLRKVAASRLSTYISPSTATDSFTINGSTPTLTIGDAGAEDTKIVFDGNAQDFHIGLDDSADDLVIGLGSTLGTTSHIVIDEAGCVTKPLQPAFMANKSASGQTPSASTAVTVVFENEVFDNNADYNTSNSTFTAPVTGRYWFHTRIRTDEVGGGTGIYSIRLVASNRTIHNTQVDLSDYLDGTMNRMTFTCTGLLDMDASDTCKVQVYEDSGYEIEDEVEETFFMGYFIG